MKKRTAAMIMAAVLALMLTALPAVNGVFAAKAEAAEQTQEEMQTLTLSFENGEPADGSEQNGAENGESPGEPPQGMNGEPPQGMPGEPPQGGEGTEGMQRQENPNGTGEGGLQLQTQEGGNGETRGSRKGGKHGEMKGSTLPGGSAENGENDSGAEKNEHSRGLGKCAVALIAGGAGLIIGSGVTVLIMTLLNRKKQKNGTDNRENAENGTEGEEDANEVKNGTNAE